MQSLIKLLRRHHQYFNPPANQAQIAQLKEQELRPKPRRYQLGDDTLNPLFDDVIALYKDHNGIPISPDTSLPIRLMSIEEAYGWNTAMHSLGRNYKYLLWTDNHSNFMGIYLDSPIIGCIYFDDHEEENHVPRFRNVREFYTSLLSLVEHNFKIDEAENSLHWGNLETTLPKLQPEPEHDANDLVIARHYKNLSQNIDDEMLSRYYAMIALNFSPVASRVEMENLAIKTDDMFVQEHAINIFKARNDVDTIPTIELLIVTGGHNAKLAGIYALGTIGGRDAQDVLLRLAHNVDTIGRRWSQLIVESLEETGIETKIDLETFSYRLHTDSEWIEIPDF